MHIARLLSPGSMLLRIAILSHTVCLYLITGTKLVRTDPE